MIIEKKKSIVIEFEGEEIEILRRVMVLAVQAVRARRDGGDHRLEEDRVVSEILVFINES